MQAMHHREKQEQARHKEHATRPKPSWRRKDINEFVRTYVAGGHHGSSIHVSQNASPSTHKSIVATPTSADDARTACVKSGVNYWRSLCGARRFPARDDLTLRGLASILANCVIVGVIDHGADYEYRYVGEAQRQAFKTYFKGIRVTEIEAAAPRLGAILRAAYDQACSTGMAFIIRGPIDHDLPGDVFHYHETAFLPLGIDDSNVDHLLIVGVQIPEPFWELPDEKLKAFAK